MRVSFSLFRRCCVCQAAPAQSSFLSPVLAWRTFACAVVCSFVLNLIASGVVLGRWGSLSEAGIATLGSTQENPRFSLIQLPFFLIVGAFGGLLGALFNTLTSQLTKWRLRYRKSRRSRIVEVSTFSCNVCFALNRRIYLVCQALAVSILVSVLSFSISYFARDCVPIVAECTNEYVLYCGASCYRRSL